MKIKKFALALSFSLISTLAFSADNSLAGLQERIVGNWKSISCELRPSLSQVDPKLAPTPHIFKGRLYL